MLTGVLVVVLLVDLLLPDREKWAISTLTGFGFLVAVLPILTWRSTTTTPARCSAGPTSSTTSRSVLKALFLVVGVRRGAHVGQLHRRGRLRTRRVLLPADLLRARHARDGLGARSHHDLRRPRAAVDPRYMLAGWRKRDLKSNEAALEVLPAWRAGVGRDALRDVAAVRRSRQHGAQRDRLEDRRVGHGRAGDQPWHLPLLRGLRVQGVRRAVPQLGARHLRRRANADHRVPLGRIQGGGLRRDHAARLHRLLRPPGRVASHLLGAGRGRR